MFLSKRGLVCSVGLDARAACAAMHAGIARFTELPYRSVGGNPLIGATIGVADAETDGAPGLSEYLAWAVGDCLQNSGERAGDALPLLLVVREASRPSALPTWTGADIAAIRDRLGVRVDVALSEVIAEGHVGAFVALDRAQRIFRSGRAEACLIAAVDSLTDPVTLLWLSDCLRLKTEENSDGVIPGEAAACVLVTAGAPAGRERAARIAGLGFATETAAVLTEEPLLGLGLAQAMEAALSDAQCPVATIDLRLSDAAGESYAFREQALAMARVWKEPRDCLPLMHVADSIGDTGAVAGLCQLIMLADGMETGVLPARRAVCSTAAVAGARAVAVVERWYRRPHPNRPHSNG